MQEILSQISQFNAQNSDWYEANRRYLMAAIASVGEALKQHAVSHLQIQEMLQNGQEIAGAMDAAPALEKFCTIFNLSEFERELLLLCAGMEFDRNWGALCAAAGGNPQELYPTFSLALKVLSAPNWNALTPNAPLRWWRAIEVGAGNSLTQSPLRIDERILHYLLGIEHLDDRLVNYVEPVPVGESENCQLPPSHRQLAEQVAAVVGSLDGGIYQLVQLCGLDAAARRAIASLACSMRGWKLHAISADVIPTDADELANLMRLWEREAILSNSALLVEWEAADAYEQRRDSAIARLIESSGTPLIVSARDRRQPRQRAFITFELNPATASEQRSIWQENLSNAASSAENLNGIVENLVANFNLSVSEIHATCAEVKTRQRDRSEGIETALWETCRARSRSRMDDLAQRIESAATWEDIVLPEAQRQTLREIIARVRQRAIVHESWGFAAKSTRGLGISALFVGASGTGKTMAADVIAKELKLDLYRIDLSAVVSKYIGETEKNLRRVFDAAETSGCVLLFDEADALFGKRSDVKDSHDRYANIEVSYLLQRMEAYRGLAILTTNLKDSLDRAFLRRLGFAVQFPFPDAAYREEIWRRIFPQQTPMLGLDFSKLAQLNVAGGNIRNIALNAAFIAADSGESVMMKHLLASAKSEFFKLEKPLTEAEVKDWV